MKLCGIIPIILVAVTVAADVRAGAVNTAHVFTYGQSPESVMAIGADGNLYGTTTTGGAYGLGTLFMLTTGGVFSNLFSFDGTNGSDPTGALALNFDGNVYGTTTSGGSNNNGTIFMVTTNGVFSSVASFTNLTLNGHGPSSGLMRDMNGTLYGTTVSGGAYGDGVVFKFVPASKSLSIVVSFAFTNGYSGEGTLAQDTNGNFYGTTISGGAFSHGTVFRVTPGGVLTNLLSFNGTNGNAPYATLVLAPDGNFYGTTYSGGTNGNGQGYGTIFGLTTNGVLTNEFYFAQTNGANPTTGLALGPDGNLYGVTYNGGANTFGAFFQFTTNGTFTLLFPFKQSTGLTPYAGLTLAGDGNLYGTTTTGGPGNGSGTVFRFIFNPAPPVFQSIIMSNSNANLTWSAISGLTYQLQYLTNLGQTTWSNLGSSIVATNITASASTSLQPDSRRFYRAVLETP